MKKILYCNDPDDDQCCWYGIVSKCVIRYYSLFCVSDFIPNLHWQSGGVIFEFIARNMVTGRKLPMPSGTTEIGSRIINLPGSISNIRAVYVILSLKKLTILCLVVVNLPKNIDHKLVQKASIRKYTVPETHPNTANPTSWSLLWNAATNNRD